MRRYYITDRNAAGGTEALLRNIQRAVEAGVERIQIREKDLSARELLRLLGEIERKGSRVLVNSRMDIALAWGADGVHLPSGSIDCRRFRVLAPPGFLIAVSCHSVADVLQAEQEGADFAVLGPIFATPSKERYGEPLGLRVLHQACHSSALPVYALGGVCKINVAACERAGAAGIAGIRLFQ